MTSPLLLGLWAAFFFFSPVSAGSCVPVGNNFDSQVLRIMPLGASIVYGYDSSDGNGFRQELRLKLLANGANVNIIGSQRGGIMPDNFVEAISGYRIDEISGLADNSTPEKPNLVIVHAGTNDIVQNYEPDTADQRLGALIDKLLAKIPGTVVLVSTLIPNLNPAVNTGIQTLNTKIKQVVADRVGAGKHVHLADMSSILLSDLNTVDLTHPTDGGYAKMADVWYRGVQEVAAQCWFESPATIAGLNDLAYTTVAAPTAPSGALPIVPAANIQTSAAPSSSASTISITETSVTPATTASTLAIPASSAPSSTSQATTISASSSTSRQVSATTTLQTLKSTTSPLSTPSAPATQKNTASARGFTIETWTWLTVCMAFVIGIL